MGFAPGGCANFCLDRRLIFRLRVPRLRSSRGCQQLLNLLHAAVNTEKPQMALAFQAIISNSMRGSGGRFRLPSPASQNRFF